MARTPIGGMKRRRTLKYRRLGLKRRTSTRRTLRRTGRLSRATTRIPRGITPFPNHCITKHKYCDRLQFPVAGLGYDYNTYIFRANGIYDPDWSGTGHQPLFRDEMAARYAFYAVLSSTIVVTFDKAQNSQKFYGCVIDDKSYELPAVFNTLVEQYGYSRNYLPAHANMPLTIRKNFNALKTFKTNLKGLMADDTYKTPVGQDPTSDKVMRFFNVWTAMHDSTVAVTRDFFTVTIYYTVLWMDPIKAIGS